MENKQKPATNKRWTTLKQWKHCEVHNETCKPGKLIKYNEHLWRKDNEHVEVKTNKNMQQNNVNGWQNLEDYWKIKKHNGNITTRRNNIEKNNEKTTQHIEKE